MGEEVQVHITTESTFSGFLSKLNKLFNTIKPGSTVVWDSMGFTSMNLIHEIMEKEHIFNKDSLIPGKPRWNDFQALAFDLQRLLNFFLQLSKKGVNVVIIAPEEAKEVYENDKLVQTIYNPFSYGQAFDRILGNMVNAIGRFTLTKELNGDLVRRIRFISTGGTRAKAQGALFEAARKSGGCVPANFTQVFKDLGGSGGVVLVYGENGVGKSLSAVLTAPKPIYVFFTEPTNPAITFSLVDFKTF